MTTTVNNNMTQPMRQSTIDDDFEGLHIPNSFIKDISVNVPFTGKP